jgi:hypothetical protein
MQGYLFHRPISLSNFIGVLRGQAPLPGAHSGAGHPIVFPTPRALRA